MYTTSRAAPFQLYSAIESKERKKFAPTANSISLFMEPHPDDCGEANFRTRKEKLCIASEI